MSPKWSRTRLSTFRDVGCLGAEQLVEVPGGGGTWLQAGTRIWREVARGVADLFVELPGGRRPVESRSETFREVADLLF
jgi:hypothetical protein